MAQVDLAIQHDLAVITLNNGVQNRLSTEMLDAFADALSTVESSDARAVLLRAQGDHFSFGGDIVPWLGMDSDALRTLFGRYMQTLNRFEQMRIPTMAVVQGRCFGGGFELALRADIIFAGESAEFGHPEQSLGIVTVLGGIYRVAERAGRGKAMEWAMTSQPVSATAMAAHGVVNRVIADDALLAEATAFATSMARGPTRAHAAHKALLRAWAVGGVDAADEAMLDIAMPLFESDDVKVALPASIRAFLDQKPRPAFPFTGR